MTIKIGDKVWFTSKFGDRVEGTYIKDDVMPSLNGDVSVCIVKSDNAFGPVSPKGVNCAVAKDNLNLVKD